MRHEYENPLATRWGAREMSALFSPDKKFRTWRALWIALAKAEKELGLPITDEQVAQLEAHRDNINYEDAEAREKETRHDVMSHVWAYGLQAPKARPIIHLGATSCYVGDNTDLIVMREALALIETRIAACMRALGDFAVRYRALPTLAFTHFQPAQLTTVGKRACLWLQDLLLDLENVRRIREELPFRGVKGTTGTQASFLALFGGDSEKVRKLDKLVSQAMGFERVFEVTGQTYPRKVDYTVLSALSGVAQSASKFANDLRLLAHLQEVEEPFGKKQIGSSAMAYKRNPMQSERVVSLARYVMNLADNAAQTAATQWFERTLDDSANRRLSIAEAFLAADVVLAGCYQIASGLVVNENVIASHVRRELPFMATENILMAAVTQGGDRQELHEVIRSESHAAAARVKEGESNDLLDRLRDRPEFAKVAGRFAELADPSRFTGRSAEQVDEFAGGTVREALKRYGDIKPPERIEV